MLFSYDWLQSFFPKKLPAPKKLAELLTLHSFEVQEIKKVDGDLVFDIDVTPNRSDCFSHLGIARECSAFTNLKFKIPACRAGRQNAKLKEDKKRKIKDFIEVEVENKNDCLRYMGGVLLDVKVGESPEWIKKRLIACGVQPINNIVDIMNYTMLETGQPLHAFDLDKLKTQNPACRTGRHSLKLKTKIIIRRAKRGEKIKTLDDKEYILDKNILVIADQEKPLAIAGIKGGKAAEITSKTKNIFIESANFAPTLIRRASRSLNLRTDASFRFEHGLDPNLAEEGLKKAVLLVQEIAEGTVAGKRIDIYSKKVKPKKIKIYLSKLEKLSGIKIPAKEVKTVLKRLNFKIIKEKGDLIEVEIPTYRQDLVIPEDLIEEILRIYGYEKINSCPPQISLTFPQKNPELSAQRKVKEILKELGFTEVYNYSFISKEDTRFFNKEYIVELENPVSEKFQYLRPSLLVNLLKNAKHNLKFFEAFKMFEVGKIFQKQGSKILEKRTLAGIIVGEKKEEGFFVLKGYIDSLFDSLGITDWFYDEFQPRPEDMKKLFWHINKSAEIKVNQEKIGFLGEVSERILHHFDIRVPIYAFEMDFEKLIEFITEEKEYQEIPKFPSAVRDIALLVPMYEKTENVQKKIFAAGGDLLIDVDLFDIYFGEGLPEGKKNLAFHLIFQAKDRTLSSEEIDNLMKKIIYSLEENPEWEVRR
ncbi:phenylalanine--tRNA ligase subunit beta [bacterium]|nr:phenylalanine--tRNA ligase subunit beta [bacterium]